jgi:hypothetical protein
VTLPPRFYPGLNLSLVPKKGLNDEAQEASARGGLYTQGTNDNAIRIAKKVKRWFSEKARTIGWNGVYFLPEVQSQHGAGCILWVSTHKTLSIGIHATTLVIDSIDDDE